MYAVVIGAGKIGISLAHWLIANGHEVTVVDRDPVRCAQVDDELGSIAVLGDGTEAGVLAKTGANRADMLIAATGLDDVNLVACQLAVYKFEVKFTMALVNISEHDRLFRMLGIGVIVNTTDVIVSHVRNELGSLITEMVGETT